MAVVGGGGVLPVAISRFSSCKREAVFYFISFYLVELYWFI